MSKKANSLTKHRFQAEGRLAFDGNKESLASDLYYVEGYSKCVCVDIRYVLWILKHYAHLDYILEELQL